MELPKRAVTQVAELQKKGFQRVKVDGRFYEIDSVPALDKKFKHDIDVVVDRLVVRPDLGTRLADTCSCLGGFLLVATNPCVDQGMRRQIDRRFAKGAIDGPGVFILAEIPGPATPAWNFSRSTR